MSQISKAVRSAVATRLADPSIGFNPKLAAAIASTLYGTAAAFSVNWSATSQQFFQGNLGPDDLDESTPSIYPMVFLYVLGSANQNLQKSCEFSGAVTAVVDFHLTWPNSYALPAFEDLLDAVEDAMFATMNTLSGAYQNWPSPITWGGGMSAVRKPVEMAGEEWRQSVSFRMPFEVSIGS